MCTRHMTYRGSEQSRHHCRDIAPEGVDWHETNANLDVIVRLAAQLQEESGVRPLWGTAQLFKHPRYKDGAATASDPLVFAYAAAQTKKAMKVCLHTPAAVLAMVEFEILSC